MMAMVTNRLGCLPVLVLLLTLSSLVTPRYLRMKRETGNNTTSINSSDTHSTTGEAEAENTSSTTLETLKAPGALHTAEIKPALNVSATIDYHGAPDLNHTQQKYSAGTENLTVHQPTDNESTLYTQLPTISNSNGTGHISQAGSSAPTFPASFEPGKVTEKQTTAATTRMSTDTDRRTTTVISTATRKSTTVTTHSCPTASSQDDRLVSRCLIAIASMAALTTIFIVSTICLATKLSGYRYRHKAHLLQETEMVCISALMNDTDHPVPKPRRHPKSNGALIPNTEDGDPDGDNLTLNSFLPDTEGPL
ncbi:P-selectin glycoprotein ligand 1 [Rhinichthys klamathensis goyatoka]|uniref:P-selectin glycoprotein ligand 1 n=1 Tax=Rhinichthys klamathensis goyatoka TaxID=3034132 RepID=UPI0024B518AA|nr:P-selectin glycoprotein ligand 1 [Rhinichthys klamathensis goyatoka]